MARQAARGVLAGVLPALLVHLVHPDHQLVDVLQAEGDVHEARGVGRHRQGGGDEEDAVVLVGPVRAREGAGATGMVGIAEAQPLHEELQRGDIVVGEEDHVVDGLGDRPRPPFAVQVQPLDVPRGVDGIRLGDHRPLGPDAQADGHAVIAQQMRRAVGVEADLAVARKVRDQRIEGGLGVYAPDGLVHAALMGEGRRQARIAAPAHHHPGSGGQLEHALVGGSGSWREAEIAPEPRAQLEVVDAEDRALNAQNRHGEPPRRCRDTNGV